MNSQDNNPTDRPSAVDVARRAAILKIQYAYVAAMPSTVRFAKISTGWSQKDRDEMDNELEARRRQTIDTLRATSLWEHASPSERAVFEQPVHQLNDQQTINISWRAETICCLAWALNLLDTIPAYDVQVEPRELLPLIKPESLDEFERMAALRPPDKLEAARSVAELWHWRSRTRQLQEQGYQHKPGQPSLDEIVTKTTAFAVANGIIRKSLSGDFPAFGRAYKDLSADEWSVARSIATERHTALNWLCGYAPNNEWDETPTDT